MTVTRLASYTTLVLISVVGFFGHPAPALAEDVQITAVVAGPGGPGVNPIVEFSGVAAPGAAVTILRGSTELSTFTADSSAGFDQTYNDQPTGQQIYEIRAVDTAGHNLAPMSFALDLVVGTTTTVSDIFLGPSIAVNPSTVTLGGLVAVSGQTYPGSTVTATVSTSDTGTAVAGIDGRWTVTFSSSDFGLGTFSVYARANSSIAGLSELSLNATFAVIPVTVPPTNTNTNTNNNTNTTTNTNTNRNTNTTTPPTNTNSGSPIPIICIGKSSADLNCDGRVNLIDLSVLLFFWQQRSPSNNRADISDEGQVGMVDFSILLFQWTG